MNTALYTVAVIVAVAALYFLFTPLVRAFLKFRGTRVVTCPETKAPAAVEVDLVRAGLPGLGRPDLRLKECTRWPERQACGQECLSQIQAAPGDCLVKNMLTKWYTGRSCTVCGTRLGEVDWLEHKPALMSPERETLEVQDIPPERVPEVLSTHQPVCWNCHVAATFRRTYPDLAVDRPARHRV